jgi:16S rRNA (adenine1518-N6/adenine1519-N6)-dimethyltransferase
MLKNELKKRINELGLTPRKPLGQNFLASEKIAKRIVNSAEVESGDVVVELGPGLGIITEKIIEKGARVVVIEIDKKLSSYLKKRFAVYPDFHIITDDFFHIDIENILNFNANGEKKFISNLPYRGAKKILKKLSRTDIFSMVVITLQKEIANKILIGPGNSEASSLTYYVNYRFKSHKLFDIPMNFFFPVPSVNSTTIKLTTKKYNIEAQSTKFVLKTIDTIFKNKRKKIKNNINSGFHISYERIDSILKNCGIDKDVRPTELSIKQIINLSLVLKEEI